MVAVNSGGAGTAAEGSGSSKGTGSAEVVEIFEDTEMKAGGDIATGTVRDTETADGTVGAVGDTVAAEDTGTVGTDVELRRSSWRRWGRL